LHNFHEEFFCLHFISVLVAGESVRFLGRWENGILAISNYRLFIQHTTKLSEVSIPIRLIETVAIKDIFQLIICCKDAVTYSCSFTTSEACIEWQTRISAVTGVPEQLENLFAFPFHAWVSESAGALDQEWYNRLQHSSDYDDDFRREVERLTFDLKGAWRISNINQDFKLCQSYPRMIVVPACITDETLQNVASFRASRRIPAVTWRHSSGAVIARSSQPEVGWLGWRNNKDEQLKALADACSFDNGKTKQSDSSDFESSSLDTSQTENVNIDKPKKILIVDARSYTSAVTNRARGGGVECPEYYPSAEIQFMSLANIHAIRKSFHLLRFMCASPADIPNWYSLLEKTLWLQHISGLLAANIIVLHAIERNNRPVLVHCSDGWDRTPQICATAQLCLDPYYRTIEGFRMLVDKEWLSFGHKFGDRCGHGVGSEETNERCPVFIQWIDCVHQIHRQFPCSFEFSMSFLIKLAQHVHSCLFGTFLCNTMKERVENSIPDRTFSVWPFVSTAIYKNPLYQPGREKVLWPAHNVRDLSFWNDVYLGSLNNHQSSDDSSNINEVEAPSDKSMTKTRSFDDLVKEMKSAATRRLSDPNISDAGLSMPLNIFQEEEEDFNEEAMMSDNMQELVMQNGDLGKETVANGLGMTESDFKDVVNEEKAVENEAKVVENEVKSDGNDVKSFNNEEKFVENGEKLIKNDLKESETDETATNGTENGSSGSGSDEHEQLRNTSKLIEASSDTLVPDGAESDDDEKLEMNEEKINQSGDGGKQELQQQHDEIVS
jgi:myotubularin-related protein 3/4